MKGEKGAAKRLESWTLRSISETLKNDGQRGAARSLAVQALAVRPTYHRSLACGHLVFRNQILLMENPDKIAIE